MFVTGGDVHRWISTPNPATSATTPTIGSRPPQSESTPKESNNVAATGFFSQWKRPRRTIPTTIHRTSSAAATITISTSRRARSFEMFRMLICSSPRES